MTYVAGTAKWGEDFGTSSGRPITWSADYFDALSVDPDFNEDDFDAALQLAFDRWEGVASIEFEFDNSGAPTDITIGARPFAFPVAGLTSITTIGAEIADVDVFFSTNVDWAPNGSADNVFGDFFAVALHEIGHAIGLEHTPDESEIMNATIFASDLGNGDIAAAQFLYGRDDEDAPLAEAEQVDPPADEFSSSSGGGGGGGILALLLGLFAFAFGLGPVGAVAAGSLPSRNDDEDGAETGNDAEQVPDLAGLIPTVPVTDEHYVFLGSLGGHTGLAGCTCSACHQQQMEDEEQDDFFL